LGLPDVGWEKVVWGGLGLEGTAKARIGGGIIKGMNTINRVLTIPHK